MPDADIRTLDLGPGRQLAYQVRAGRGPTVVFLPGFRSSMAGEKATALDQHCARTGLACVRLDYRGHGVSSGRFEDGCVGDWAADAVAVLDEACGGDVILVGSSMGGWIMLLAALARPGRVKGLVGIAAAPDFTERLIWDRATPEQRSVLTEQGIWHEPSAYGEPLPITIKLIEDGRRHLLLDAPIPIACPVHLIHGQEDPDVPWQTALTLAARLESDAVTVELVKDGDHRLSRDADLRRIMAAVERLANSGFFVSMTNSLPTQIPSS